MTPERAAQCLREIGICFLYAPDLHTSMKQVQKVRRELRMRTMFNLLGPLTNPAHASGQVVGVYALEMVEKLAEALSMLGLRRALVVHGLDGLDEITISGPTRVAEAREGTVRTYEVDPEDFGLARATLEDISGGDAGGKRRDYSRSSKWKEICATGRGVIELRRCPGGRRKSRSSARWNSRGGARNRFWRSRGEAGRISTLHCKLKGCKAHVLRASSQRYKL